MAASFDINAKIEEELNSLSDQEDDVNKLARATHRSLLMLSIKDAVMEMRKREKENEEKNEKNEENEENEINLFHELIKKSYLEKIDFMRKQLPG